MYRKHLSILFSQQFWIRLSRNHLLLVSSTFFTRPNWDLSNDPRELRRQKQQTSESRIAPWWRRLITDISLRLCYLFVYDEYSFISLWLPESANLFRIVFLWFPSIMGKDQEFLEAARNGNVVIVEKLLNSKAKRGGPLARYLLNFDVLVLHNLLLVYIFVITFISLT